MTAHLPTGSRLELADTCLGSALFDDGIDETNEWSESGNVIHAFLENVENRGVEAALEGVEDADMRAICEQIDVDGLGLGVGAWAAEVTFAWNWRTDTARELGRGLKRNYAARTPDEIVLTVDRASLLGADAVIVGDYKTGYRRLRPARRHAQLRMGALAASRVYGRERARVEIIQQRPFQRPWVDRAELDLFDLAEVACERRSMAMEILRHRQEKTEPRLRFGDHCDRCGGRWSCRARTAELVAIARDPGKAIDVDLSTMTPEIMQRVDQRIEAIDAALKVAKAARRAWAVKTPIPRGDGYVYGLHHIRKPVVDGRKAWDHLEAQHGREVAHAAVVVKTSKSAIKEALKPIAPKRGLTKMHTSTLAELEAIGALTYEEATKVEEFRPGEPVAEIEE